MDTIQPVISIENTVDKQQLPFVEYVFCNVPGEGADTEAFEIQYAGCSCTGNCHYQNCSCLTRYGHNYQDSGKLLSINVNNFARPVLECNRECSCSPNCSNRQVQKGIQFALCIFKTENKGWGLKTKEFIPCNHFVCEYAGEVIDKDTAKRRLESLTPADSNYLLVVREHVAGNKLLETFIDPKCKGNIGRYINHSCEPNLFMVPVRIDILIPKVCLFAVRDIQADEELTFNYSGLDESSNNIVTQGNNCSTSLKPCACSSDKCNGYLPFCNGLLSDFK